MLRSDISKKINYTVTCISAFSEKYKRNTQDSFRYLYDHKAIDFFTNDYDIEHTLSIEDAVQDMFLICRNNGGTW